MKWKFNINKVSFLGSGLASFGAILASSCCIIPIALFNLGVGGAWLANLAILQPYRMHFIGVAILMFAIGLFLFIRSQVKSNGTCSFEDGKRIRHVPTILATSAILIAGAIIWPKIEPYLLKAI